MIWNSTNKRRRSSRWRQSDGRDGRRGNDKSCYVRLRWWTVGLAGPFRGIVVIFGGGFELLLSKGGVVVVVVDVFVVVALVGFFFAVEYSIWMFHKVETIEGRRGVLLSTC